tara:strand:- start:12827 stop:13081 length:255 start_codon:yes stop_codon:yes gene_type:complete
VYSYSFLVLLLFVLGGCSFLDLPSALEVLSDPEVQGGLRDVATNALSGNVVGALWALGGVVGCVATSKARKALKSKKLKPSESV